MQVTDAQELSSHHLSRHNGRRSGGVDTTVSLLPSVYYYPHQNPLKLGKGIRRLPFRPLLVTGRQRYRVGRPTAPNTVKHTSNRTSLSEMLERCRKRLNIYIQFWRVFHWLPMNSIWPLALIQRSSTVYCFLELLLVNIYYTVFYF